MTACQDCGEWITCVCKKQNNLINAQESSCYICDKSIITTVYHIPIICKACRKHFLSTELAATQEEWR